MKASLQSPKKAKAFWPLLLLGALLLSGCGQKGPLTLPPATAAEQAQ